MTLATMDEANQFSEETSGSEATKRKLGGYKGAPWKKRLVDKPVYTGENVSALINKTVDDSDQLYAYNVTNFKVEEIISEAVYSRAQKAAIRTTFDKLQENLMSPEAKQADELEVLIPSPPHRHRDKILSECQFYEPISVELCGSFVAGHALSSDATVDVRVVMPKKFYGKKDYLNQRWLVRKGYYAAVLANKLTSSEEEYTVHYACPNDNPLDICLLVKVKESVTFKLLLHTEEGLFLNKRLLPLCSNVRPQHLGLTAVEGEVFYTWSVDDLGPTPLYNHTLAVNQIYKQTEELMNEWNSHDVIRQCMILTRLWLHQRSLDQGFQCMNSFIVRMFMVYQLSNKKLAFHTTAHQIFIAFLQKIVSFDWTSPFSLKNDISPEVLANHQEVSEIVFIDPTGLVNYCATVSIDSLQQLQHFAKETVSIILKGGASSFEDTFIKKVSPHLYYDQAISISSISKLKCSDESRYLDSCGDTVYSCLPKILQVIKQSLGERVNCTAISAISRSKTNVASGKSFSTKTNKDRIIIRFLVNPDMIHNTLERGPPADDPAAEQFRELWGGKSDLRRFMDGAICEAVVWPAETTRAKRLLLGQIVTYALARHCGMRSCNVVYAVNQLDHLLLHDSYNLKRNQATGEEECQQYQAEFHIFCKTVRAIRSLPLNITNVIGLDPLSRNTKIFAPVPWKGKAGKNILSYEPNRVMVEVEGNKWPNRADKENAIATLKLLMLIQLKQELSKLEGHQCLVRDGGLTVYKKGYQYDVTLMNNVELIGVRNAHNSNKGDKQLYIDYIVIPLITNTLSGLQNQHGSYAATARLLKRWAGVHMFSSFLPEPFTDLIAASVFTSPTPFQVPRCPMVAFHRCLNLLVHHDWSNEPLILNFNDELSEEKITELKTDFRVRRIHYPCATVATPIDKQSLITKRVMPFMLKLVRDTAANCLNAVDSLLADGEWKSEPIQAASFTADHSMIDVLIELKSERSRRQPITLSQDDDKVEVFYDPALDYVKHIEESYKDKMVVMYDSSCFKYIGLICKPGCFYPASVERACTEGLRAARTLEQIDEDLCVKLDIKALLQDLNLSGQDIVSNITVQNLPSQ